MKLKTTLLSTAMVLLSGSVALASTVAVFKTASCGCCGGWIAHLEQAGFTVTAEDLDDAPLEALKTKAGITAALASCHTAVVEGYVIEGHVPAADVARLLAERPEAIGLAVPGMPSGTPGMGETGEPYDVLLVLKDGRTAVFASH